jgi:hypothetical protein
MTTNTIKVVKETACLMLVDQNNNLIDHEFINKYQFDYMTKEELNNEIEKFAARNNLTNYKVI